MADLKSRRQEVLDALSSGLLAGELSRKEFERRVDRVHAATSVAELDAAVADLPPPDSEVVPVTQAIVPVPREQRTTEPSWMLSVFSTRKRRGAWRCPPHLSVIASFGDTFLDFRDASLNPGVTEVEVTTVFADVHIVLPPGLAVEMEGIGFFGDFDDLQRVPRDQEADDPMLHIGGQAIFGDVVLRTLPRGYDAREARRHRRREKRLRRQARRGRRRGMKVTGARCRAAGRSGGPSISSRSSG